MKNRQNKRSLQVRLSNPFLSWRRDEEDGPNRTVLRFTPYAWAKLHYFCHRGPTEIGGFGISSPDDPSLIEQFVTVRQKTTSTSVEFEDDAVAEFANDQVDLGRKPTEFLRVWLHTHPWDNAEPSGLDEKTFTRVFGACDYGIMFILAKSGATYARLRFSAGPGGQLCIPVEIDFDQPFEASDHEAWEQEYLGNIQPLGTDYGPSRSPGTMSLYDEFWPVDWDGDECVLRSSNSRSSESTVSRSTSEAIAAGKEVGSHE